MDRLTSCRKPCKAFEMPSRAAGSANTQDNMASIWISASFS